MRVAVSLITCLATIVGFALATNDAQATWARRVPASAVKNACHGRLQSGNGQTGCTRCDAGVCRDYNCSDGSHGVPKGCKETFIERKNSKRTSLHSPHAGIKSTRDNAPPKHGRHLTGVRNLRKATYHRSTGPTNPNGPGGSTGPFAPPNHRRTGNGGMASKPMLHQASEHHSELRSGKH